MGIGLEQEKLVLRRGDRHQALILGCDPCALTSEVPPANSRVSLHRNRTFLEAGDIVAVGFKVPWAG